MANKALFLDRDGVINIDFGYVSTEDSFEFTDGIFDACRFFQAQGFKLVVVTNQSGIARGFFTENSFENLTSWMCKQFEFNGCFIDKVYHCPHHPDISGECGCRKPKTGMIKKAEKDLDLDLSRSIMIGDKISDVQASTTAGIGLSVRLGSNFLEYKETTQLGYFRIPTVKNFREIYKIYLLLDNYKP